MGPSCGGLGCDQSFYNRKMIAGDVNEKPFCRNCWRKYKAAEKDREMVKAKKKVTDVLDAMVLDSANECPQELALSFQEFVGIMKNRAKLPEKMFRAAFIHKATEQCKNDKLRAIFERHGDEFPEDYKPKKYIAKILDGMNLFKRKKNASL